MCQPGSSGKGASRVNVWLLVLRFWTNYYSICALYIPWIITTRASTPMRMKCPTAVASSMFEGPCHPTASVMAKVSSQLPHLISLVFLSS